MIPPTSIDGTDITGATIDGTDVQEITVDGQTVFTAVPQIPSSTLTQNLVAWYRYEDGDGRDYASSAEFPNTTFADSTSYDGNTPNLNFVSSGGADDFAAGDDSQFVRVPDLSTGDDVGITVGSDITRPLTFMAWVKADSVGSDNVRMVVDAGNDFSILMRPPGNGNEYVVSAGGVFIGAGALSTDWKHIAATVSTTQIEMFIDGVSQVTDSISSFSTYDLKYGRNNFASQGGDDNGLDDLRFYDKILSQSEINSIYVDTDPN